MSFIAFSKKIINIVWQVIKISKIALLTSALCFVKKLWVFSYTKQQNKGRAWAFMHRKRIPGATVKFLMNFLSNFFLKIIIYWIRETQHHPSLSKKKGIIRFTHKTWEWPAPTRVFAAVPGIGKGLQPWLRAGHVPPRFWVEIYK